MLAFWGDRGAGLASLSWAGLEFGEGAFTSREPRTRRLVGEEFMAAEGQRRVWLASAGRGRRAASTRCNFRCRRRGAGRCRGREWSVSGW